AGRCARGTNTSGDGANASRCPQALPWKSGLALQLAQPRLSAELVDRHRSARPNAPHLHPLDPDLDPRTKIAAPWAAIRLCAWSTATGIRTPVSGLRIRRPSPLDDSGEDEAF